MHLYLPIAGLSVNALVIVLLGGAVGILSGMFGVGGGFLTTPLLIFYGAGLYISPLAPFLLGLITGLLTVLMGVGGGFILVPAMLYVLGVSARVVVGTSLFQGLFVTAATTLVHALTTHAVDLVLAGLLLVGSVTGAQIGSQVVQQVRPERARMMLALIVLTVAIRMALGLTWHPDALYTVQLL